jgi:hypothetical protein
MRAPPSILSGVYWLTAACAVLILIYFVTAPPIMMSIIKSHGFSSQSPGLWIYKPVIMIMESDFGGPLVWYFNRVWNAKVEFFGEETLGPGYVFAGYIVLAALLIIASSFPFYRRFRPHVL